MRSADDLGGAVLHAHLASRPGLGVGLCYDLPRALGWEFRRERACVRDGEGAAQRAAADGGCGPTQKSHSEGGQASQFLRGRRMAGGRPGEALEEPALVAGIWRSSGEARRRGRGTHMIRAVPRMWRAEPGTGAGGGGEDFAERAGWRAQPGRRAEASGRAAGGRGPDAGRVVGFGRGGARGGPASRGRAGGQACRGGGRAGCGRAGLRAGLAGFGQLVRGARSKGLGACAKRRHVRKPGGGLRGGEPLGRACAGIVDGSVGGSFGHAGRGRTTAA